MLANTKVTTGPAAKFIGRMMDTINEFLNGIQKVRRSPSFNPLMRAILPPVKSCIEVMEMAA
jgi:hypothetical protein